MTSSNQGADGNALAGPLQDVFCVDLAAAQGAARSSCGWCVVPAAPGWTYAA